MAIMRITVDSFRSGVGFSACLGQRSAVSVSRTVSRTMRCSIQPAPFLQTGLVVKRTLYTTSPKRNDHVSTTESASPSTPSATSDKDASILATYSAPLAKTFVRLKIFSLSSLAAAIALTPALLLAPAEVGWAGRIGLCFTALATSGASTAIFAWIGKPYVGTMRLLAPEVARLSLQRDVTDPVGTASATAGTPATGITLDAKPAIEAITTDWRLRKLRTTIYEPSLIRPTSRPLATWELTAKPPALAQEKPASAVTSADSMAPATKLIAATRVVKGGKLVGRWWASWPVPGQAGQCMEEGSVIRHYSIHEELLDDEWRVL